jgi:hypothetical protein
LDAIAHQVELVVQVFIELGHHFARLEAAPIARQPLHPARHGAHEGEVIFDHGQHVGPQHLDRDLAPVVQAGRSAPARWRRWATGSRSKCANTAC